MLQVQQIVDERAKRPVISSEFNYCRRCHAHWLISLVPRTSHQASCYAVCFFIILTRLITRSALQLVTATLARIFIRHDRLVNEDNSSNALIGFTKVLFTHRSGDCCCCSTDSSVPSTSLSAASSPVVEMTRSFLHILSVSLQRDPAVSNIISEL